jgi:hypothetical protein
MLPSEVPTIRVDRFVSIPTTDDGGVVELRPGIDDDTVRLDLSTVMPPEVSIRDLRRGLKLIEEEHAR